MMSLARSAARSIARSWRDRRGITTVMFGILATSLGSMVALSIDAGMAINAQSALRANTVAAVLNAAQVWSNTGSQTSATTAATSWHTAHPVAGATNVVANTPVYSCATSTTGLPNCSGTAPNVSSM